MGYQESYVTSNNKEHFERLLKKIQSMRKDYYDSYGAWPVEIITFLKEHDNFRKGQQAIYFVGERYPQREYSVLIGYTDEGFENLSENKIIEQINEINSYKIIRHYTEDVDPSGIWEDAGVPLFTIHEKFDFDKEYKFPEGTWGFSDLDDYSNEEDEDIYDNEDTVEFFYELRLRNYPNSFLIVDADVDKKSEYFEEDDEAPIEVTCYKGIYRDNIKNNTLILNQIRYEGEAVDDMNIVVDAISNEAYDYLMKELNNNDNVTVFWDQVYGTTSDYIIVYDKFGENCLYDMDYLKELFKKESCYKYRYVKNGKIHKITPEMMGKILF